MNQRTGLIDELQNFKIDESVTEINSSEKTFLEKLPSLERPEALAWERFCGLQKDIHLDYSLKELFLAGFRSGRQSLGG